MFSLILIIFLFNLNLFTLQRQQQVTNKYVYVCGQYPNKYLSYAPCPEEGQKQQICSQSGWILMNIKCNQDSDCQISNQNVALNKCDRGECCAPPPSDSGGTKKGDDVPYIKWQMCENGGYFTGKKCKDTTECFSNRPNVQQICLHNECCTTGGIGGGNVNPVEDK
uniref:CC domain-containing protein n=1 Tax=Meloidogyne hapla TaxID=6305 RepID=A0A1I8AZ03_MELHA